jgi:nitrate reductase beta subunit
VGKLKNGDVAYWTNRQGQETVAVNHVDDENGLAYVYKVDDEDQVEFEVELDDLDGPV